MSEILVKIRFEINCVQCICMKIVDKYNWKILHDYVLKNNKTILWCRDKYGSEEVYVKYLLDDITIIDNTDKINGFKKIFGNSLNNDNDLNIFDELYQFEEESLDDAFSIL